MWLCLTQKTVHENNEYFVMIEQQLLVKTNDFRESIFLLIAVHYVFDLEYDSAVGDTLLSSRVCV